MEQEIINLLKQNALSVTESRKKVLALFLKSKGALEHSSIEKSAGALDRVTIYRTLQCFMEKGLIHTIPSDDNSIKYALCESSCKCTPEFTHAHFHCNNCNQTFCLRNIHLPEINLPKNFEVEQSSFILKGICDQCKS